MMYDYTHLDEELVEFVEIIGESELGNGERLFIEIDGQSIVIFNVADRYFAIADVCSHDNGPLGDGELDENDVICPRHGARFDIRSGKATMLPAVGDIPAYPVRIRGGTLEVGLPKKR